MLSQNRIELFLTFIPSFLAGSAILCILSIFQKIDMGTPLLFEGFIVPFFFGGIIGLLISIRNFKIKQISIELKDSHDKLENRVKERTAELEKVNRELHQEIINRKQAEEKIHIEWDNLNSIYESMEDGVYVCNQQNDIEFVNQALIKNFGPFEGRKCYEYFHDKSEACTWCRFDEVSTKKTIRWESFHSKTQRYYDIIDTLLKHIDGSISKLQILRDVTDHKQAEEQIKASLKEKETLLQEIHHRVKNNMSVISGLLYLQMNSIDNEIAKEALQDSQNRVQSMSKIHETLYRSDNLSAIDLKTYLSELGKTIFQNYSISSKVQFKVEAKNIMIGAKQASTVGLIVNELIANCLKYAFTDDRKGEIVLSLKSIKENGIEMTVSDNGVGIPDDFDLKTADSLGLKLVKLLAENQLDGSIDMESNNGTKFTIKFKIET
jgi:two-component sensor histidine kinase/PAS domain-containing protein